MKGAKIHSSIYIWELIIFLVPTITPFVQIHGFRPLLYGTNVLLFVALILNGSIDKRILNNKLILLYALLIVYHFINCYVQKVPMTSGNGYLAFFTPILSNFCMMTLLYAMFLENRHKALRYLCVSYLLWVILAYQSVSEVEGRLIGDYIHPNQYAQAAGMGLFVILLTKHLNLCKTNTMVLMSLLPVGAILGCGSRNGLGLLFIFMFALVVSNIQGRIVSTKQIIGAIIAFVGFVYAGEYIIENTFLGERFLTHETSEKFYVKTGTIIDLLGDRAIYYVLGYRNFLTNPLFGIGLWHFNTFNNFGYPLHSEYMIHFCEGGIIGISLYLLFIGVLLYKLVMKYIKDKNGENFVVLMTFLAYLFIGLTAREFYYSQFFPVLGICIAWSENRLNKNRITRNNYLWIGK